MIRGWLSRLAGRRRGATARAAGERWARVTEIVDGALKRPEARERRRYLRRACGGDGELRREVEELLSFEDADSGVLAGPLFPGRPADGTVRPGTLAPGDTVGPYRVVEILGEGGMGVVARVHDPELDRHVAFKLLRRDAVSDELLRRFETERRVLARLDHPSIARIFGSGTVEGLPYFTMEVVDGEPIDTYCDARRLTVEERLRLVLEVCDALAEAHRNLVVHRDLKPGNVLVSETAGGAEPKVLDFGIAKELDPLAGGAAITRTGHQPLTAAYASPEQVRGLPVTVATDVYSLGVLLYRLLCGHPPYLLDGDHFENVRTLCEAEPPPPSSRAVVALEVWTEGAPTTVAPSVLAERRGSEPRALRRRLRGDLDSIVLKALAKDPAGRYRSVEGLADDLRRHLEGLPVSTRAASFGYRAGKVLRRYRGRLAAAAVAAGLLLGAGWYRVQSTRQMAGLEAEQARAEQQADALQDFLRRLLRSVSPELTGGGPITARELLERGRERLSRDLRDQPELLAHQLEAIALAYRDLRDSEAAIPVQEESVALRRQVYGRDGETRAHPLLARGISNLATLYFDAGRLDDAEAHYREALAMRRGLGQSGRDLAAVESGLAAILAIRGSFDEAESLYRRVLATRIAIYGEGALSVATTRRSLGNLLYLRGELGAAEQLLRQALEVRERGHGRRSLGVAAVLSSLGRVLRADGRQTEAEAAFVEALSIRRELLDEDHPVVALTKKDLARLYFELGEDATARVLWDQALAVLWASHGPGSWEIADAESQLGARLLAAGRGAEAEPCLVDGFETLRRLRGEESIYTREAGERRAGLF